MTAHGPFEWMNELWESSNGEFKFQLVFTACICDFIELFRTPDGRSLTDEGGSATDAGILITQNNRTTDPQTLLPINRYVC